MDKSWINKYTPKTLENVLGHKSHIASFEKWIQQFNNDVKPYTGTIMVYGDHGIGKSLVVKLMLEKHNYDTMIISSSNIKEFFDDDTSKDKKNVLIKYLVDDSKNDMNKLITLKRKAIVITDAEKITLKKESNALMNLCKINEINKVVPIIFVTNDKHSKLIVKIKAMSYCLNFEPPHISEFTSYFKQICKQENIVIADEKLVGSIIKYTQYDIRNLLYFLENLSNVYGSEPITMQHCKTFLKNIQPKDKRHNLYDSTRMLLNDYKGINKCLTQYSDAKVLLPLMIHENYSNNLENRSCTAQDFFKSCATISDSMSNGDVISTNMYTDQNWNLQKCFGFLTCCKPTFELSKYKLRNPNYKIIFSGDLNSPSIKNINRGNVVRMHNLLNKKLTDILIIKKLLVDLFARQKLTAIKNMFRQYDIAQADLIKYINVLLKVDKTSEIVIIQAKMGKILAQL